MYTVPSSKARMKSIYIQNPWMCLGKLVRHHLTHRNTSMIGGTKYYHGHQKCYHVTNNKHKAGVWSVFLMVIRYIQVSHTHTHTHSCMHTPLGTSHESQANECHLSLTPHRGRQSNHTQERERGAGPARPSNKAVLPLVVRLQCHYSVRGSDGVQLIRETTKDGLEVEGENW